jgi:hypothetical protein
MGGSGRPQAPSERAVGGAAVALECHRSAPKPPSERAVGGAAVALEWFTPT